MQSFISLFIYLPTVVLPLYIYFIYYAQLQYKSYRRGEVSVGWVTRHGSRAVAAFYLVLILRWYCIVDNYCETGWIYSCGSNSNSNSNSNSPLGAVEGGSGRRRRLETTTDCRTGTGGRTSPPPQYSTPARHQDSIHPIGGEGRAGQGY